MEELFIDFYESSNKVNAIIMQNYMKNNFIFLGIKSPERKELSKLYLKYKAKSIKIDWKFINTCFKKNEREFQYLAIDYLNLMTKKLIEKDIEKIEKLIITKSWWDTVDGLNNTVGILVKNNSALKETKIKKWAQGENIWLKRISIIYQLKQKDKVDQNLLEYVINVNMGSREFFVNKAIGWMLREYARTNKQWVLNFIETNCVLLNNLSKREALKNI